MQTPQCYIVNRSVIPVDPEIWRQQERERLAELFLKLDAVAMRLRVALQPSTRRMPVPSKSLVHCIVSQEALEAYLSPEDVLGPKRRTPIVRARWRVWVRLRAYGYSLPGIGRQTGRDHTSILHALRRSKELGL